MDEWRLRARDTFAIAAAGAMVGATVHVALFWIRVVLLDGMAGASRELPWISPLSFLMTFLVVAAPIAAMARLWPRRITPVRQGIVLGTLAALGILLHLVTVHPAALLLLSVGMGVTLGRWLGRDIGRGMRMVRRTAVVLATLLFLAGLPGVVYYRWRQGGELAALPPARTGAPNVILLILDTVRAANLSVYGYDRPTTPTLGGLATEGVLFESAIATAPWTGPSHATLLTGRYPFFTGISYLAPMADSLPTITEAFRSVGYATGAFMGNAYFGGRVTGFDRAFIRYDDYPVSLEQAFWSSTFTQLDVVRRLVEAVRRGELSGLLQAVTGAEFRRIGVNQGDNYSAAELVENFQSWHAGLDGRPFFAMINFFDAHSPYETPLATRFDGGSQRMDRYDGAIAYADSMIGQLVAHLREAGVLDQTILMVTSDHGEQFGEHGLWTHGNSLYRELLHVPLVIRAPGRVPSGTRVSSVVSLRDVPATLLDLAGVGAGAFPGTSLAGLWRDSAGALPSVALAEAEHPPHQSESWPTAYGPMKAVVTDRFHYVRRGDGQEIVEQWAGDAGDADPMTASEAWRQAVAESRAALRAELGPRWPARGPS